MTDSDFLWPCSDYLWKMRVIPVCRGKTLWRPSALLCKLWEIRPGAALMRVRSKRHISWICQSGFLNECDAMCIQYERAVCVDTCSEARMCPDSQPAGVSVEPQSLHLSPSFPCAVKEAFIPPPSKMSLYRLQHRVWFLESLPTFICVFSFFLAQRHRPAKLCGRRSEGFLIKWASPASPFKA